MGTTGENFNNRHNNNKHNCRILTAVLSSSFIIAIPPLLLLLPPLLLLLLSTHAGPPSRGYGASSKETLSPGSPGCVQELRIATPKSCGHRAAALGLWVWAWGLKVPVEMPLFGSFLGLEGSGIDPYLGTYDAWKVPWFRCSLGLAWVDMESCGLKVES